MKLNAKKRVGEKKSAVKQMRRDGDIPGIIYSPATPAELIQVNAAEFETALRGIKPGMLATTVFKLNLENKNVDAIVKDIQYELTTYKVIHLDFELLTKDVPVTVNVPVNCIGVAECAGVKLGGFLRQVIRFIKVKCLPKDIPQQFEMDVRDLGLGKSLRLSNIAMPTGVKPLAPTDEVVVVVAKR